MKQKKKGQGIRVQNPRKFKLSKKSQDLLDKYFGGRMPTKEEIMEKLKESVDQMVQALGQALECAPDDLVQQTRKAYTKSLSFQQEIHRLDKPQKGKKRKPS